MGRGTKPPLAVVNRSHPLGPRGDLTRFVAYTEGAGIANDCVSRRPLTPVAVPTWTTLAQGFGRTFVSGSSQYDDAGNWPELSGAVRFTLIFRCKRTTATTTVMIAQMGTTTNAHVNLGPYSDGNVYASVSNGSDSFGTIAQADAAEHEYAMVYNGGLSGNANRLLLYMDGAVQTLSFTGTIPATAPTTTDSMRIGHVAHVPAFSSGSASHLKLYTRCLTAAEILEHYQEPFGSIQPANYRRVFLFGSDLRIPQPTATPSDEAPTIGYALASTLPTISVKWTPRDVLNPVTNSPALTLSLNGVALTVTATSLAGGVYTASAQAIVKTTATNTVVATATTQDGTPNNEIWTFTSRRFVTVNATTDEYVRYATSTDERSDYALALITPTDERTDYVAAFTSGFSGEVSDLVDYASLDVAGGLLNAVAEPTDVLVVEEVKAAMMPFGARIGEFGKQDFPLGFLMSGFDHVPLLELGTAVTGTEYADLFPLGANISTYTQTWLLALGALLGTFGQRNFPIGARIDPYFAAALLDILIASAAQQAAEAEE